LATAGDEPGRLARQLDRLARTHQSSRDRGGAPGDADASGDDRLHRLAAASAQSPAHALGIESPGHCPRRRASRRGSGAVAGRAGRRSGLDHPSGNGRNGDVGYGTSAVIKAGASAPRSAPTNGGGGSGIASPPGGATEAVTPESTSANGHPSAVAN